jgi:glycosyltransferase involved in cell wall biosynthesis
MKLTILMPCLNEAETLGLCIKKAGLWIAASGADAEVLVADNGSTDGSQAIALGLGARVVAVEEKGYGSALFHGVLAASGEWIIMGDADDSYDFSRLDAFVERLSRGEELVMGNRFAGGIAPGAMPWKNRYIGNPILSRIGILLFKCPIRDFHCGLRAFTKGAFLRMDLRTSGMEFATEMVIKATLAGMRVCEVPTTLAKDGRSRPPHLKPWRDGWRHLKFMMLFSPNWLFMAPSLSLGLASVAVYLALLGGQVRVGSVTFDYHSLLFAEAGIVLGCLGLSFGLLIRMVAIREGLLNGNALLDRLRTSPTLELGSGAGVALMLAGLIHGMWLLAQWGSKGFGPLRPLELLRATSLSTLLLVLGGILLYTSLVLGFLELPTRERRNRQK